MSNDLLKHLSNKLQEEIRVITDDLSLGKAKDHGDYKYATGMIRGLMVANAIIADMAERYEEIE
jgi:ABC-type Na+ transport system ATPase subunit NatA